ncbi:MAG TPA: hypothetical protein VJQ55_11445 [Candidatus Binatia bacterium]|nr:hypothetical protein [Candidatus Binatia bacterium]
MIIGFSTGAIALGNFTRALTLLGETNANAVELSALRSVELPLLIEALPLLLSSIKDRYEYISFHAPTDFEDDRELVDQLIPVAKMGLNVIVHPDTIHEVSHWRELGDRLCIENMDSRKETGRTVEELSIFFRALPDARLCFDIAHARQVDVTMTEAARIISRFGDRLAQVHVSELNSKGKHFPMSFLAKGAYEQFAEVLSQVPVILESVVSETGIALELREIERVLTHNDQFATRE